MRSLLRAQCRRFCCSQQSRNLATRSTTNTIDYPLQVGASHFQEGDRVLVTNKDGKKYKSRLIDPLEAGGSIRTGLHSYQINHDDIIGQPTGRVHVHADSSNHKGKSTIFRVTHPSFEQFITLTPRSVTPIYSSYGATIVDLLGIHAVPPSPSNHPTTSGIPRFEILEAGTGHGGLTLHLARAIAAANPPPPYFEPASHPSGEEVQTAWRKWQADRRSIVHTVEFHAARSRVAEKVIKSFRGALYWPHIDFHAGDVGAWVKTEQARRTSSIDTARPFLDVVILDLPAVDQQIQHVVDAMKDAGQLLVWVPQITQIAACQREINRLRMPLNLDQVIELGEGISTGRQWDVRFVKTRLEQSKGHNISKDGSTETLLDSAESSAESEHSGDDIDAEEPPPPSNIDFPTMVCRPLVGERITGGGFVGLWRRKARPMTLNIAG